MIESSAEFIRLVESDDSEERRRAAWEPAPDEVWCDVIQKYPDMHFWVGHNRTVPPNLLLLLSESPDWRTRFRIAAKRNATPELLEILSSDTDDSVLASVAGNRNTPVDALLRLAGHPWAGVHEKAREQLDERGVAWS